MTAFAFKPLFAGLFSPSNYCQATASPAALFLKLFMHKKSLVKPVSLNFLQIFIQPALQPILPTIFQ